MKALIVLAIGLTISLLIVVGTRSQDVLEHKSNETVVVTQPQQQFQNKQQVVNENNSKKLSVTVADNFTATELEIKCADLWQKFLFRATPTEHQQQVILSAIVDSRLNYEEERKVRTEELIQATIEGNENELLKSNRKNESVSSILRTEVAQVAKENLDSNQYQYFLKTFGNCIDSSVVAKIIRKN